MDFNGNSNKSDVFCLKNLNKGNNGTASVDCPTSISKEKCTEPDLDDFSKSSKEDVIDDNSSGSFLSVSGTDEDDVIDSTAVKDDNSKDKIHNSILPSNSTADEFSADHDFEMDHLPVDDVDKHVDSCVMINKSIHGNKFHKNSTETDLHEKSAGKESRDIAESENRDTCLSSECTETENKLCIDDKIDEAFSADEPIDRNNSAVTPVKNTNFENQETCVNRKTEQEKDSPDINTNRNVDVNDDTNEQVCCQTDCSTITILDANPDKNFICEKERDLNQRSRKDGSRENSFNDNHASEENFEAKGIDDADESFSLDEILEESGESEKHSDKENFSCKYDFESSIRVKNSVSFTYEKVEENIIPFANRQSRTSSPKKEYVVANKETENVEKDETTENSVDNYSDSSISHRRSSAKNDPVVINNEAEFTFQDVNKDGIGIGKNETRENSSTENQNFSLVIQSVVKNSCGNVIDGKKVSPKRNQIEPSFALGHQPPCQKQFSQGASSDFQDVCSPAIIDDTSIRISPKKDVVREDSLDDHQSHSPAIICGKDEHSVSLDIYAEVTFDPSKIPKNLASTDPSASEKDCFEVQKDNVLSSYEVSVPSPEKLVECLPLDIQNHNVSENTDEIMGRSTIHGESSHGDELTSASMQELSKNLRKRIPSQSRKNSDDSEALLSDTNTSDDTSSSLSSKGIHSRNKNYRCLSKSPVKNFGSDWQPRIDSVGSTSEQFFTCIKKTGENMSLKADVKEEIIDEVDTATKEKFKIINFCIKLEKLDFDDDDNCGKQITPPSPRKTKQAPKRNVENNANARTRSRSEILRSKLQSRSATIRKRLNDRRHPVKLSATRNSAQSGSNEENSHRGWQMSTRRSVRSDGENPGPVNEQMQTQRHSSRLRINSQVPTEVPAKVPARNGDENRRSLRLSGTNVNEQDRDRIDFLRLFNLRSRKNTGDPDVKGILVKPKANSKVPSKKVSFQLPADDVSKERNNASSKTKDVSSKTLDRSSTGPAQRKRKVVPERSTKTIPEVPSKKNKNSPSQSDKAVKVESEEVVIDENPYEKFEKCLEIYRKTVDVWYKCLCCHQKYFLVEKAKQHVRSHFPNCLTN